ncbi:protein DpdD [Amycolatopsis sp. NPDC051128]|uniref:protein DpdD n=1 Tax=Amycolatopsis sp. NPDC051128 TaxID=3155412 RepID=UPI00342BE11F
MNITELLQRCMGDAEQFKDFRERVELLVEEQARGWDGGPGGWLVVPVNRLPRGFYLISRDPEGQRRGREVLRGFLGPAEADFETTPLAPDAQQVDKYLVEAGFGYLASVTRNGPTTRERLLVALEDMLATVSGRELRAKRPQPSQYLDLLRDFRLALAQGDGRQADDALNNLRLTGRLSAENLRFLKVELLGALGRWDELRGQDFLIELLRARRPRAINEYLMEMIWRTEIGELVARDTAPDAIYTEHNLGSRYGNVLSAVDVSNTEPGRALSVVVATALNDEERLQRLLAGAVDSSEQELLRGIARHRLSAATPESLGIRDLFEQGQRGAVVRAFVQAPTPETAEFAVESILEAEDATRAGLVLEAVQQFVDAELLVPGRRLRRDIEELAVLAGSRCADWSEWGVRIGNREPWPDGARVLRAQHGEWTSIEQLSSKQVEALAYNLLGAWEGANQEQILAALDVLCEEAATVTAVPHAAEFCDAVQVLLAEQNNLSGPVREAYLRLLDQVLAGAPTTERYIQAVAQAMNLWTRISAPTTVDWGIGLADLLLIHPSADLGVRVEAISAIVGKARDFGQRSSLRQRTEIELLAVEIGIPPRQLAPATTGVDVVWSRLDGQLVGVYSLLPRAAESLERRLKALCSPKSVEGNADRVSTSALKNLADKADFMIVDTWHASHAATGAIDAVLPRNKQICPQGRGVSSYLQALEQALLARDA